MGKIKYEIVEIDGIKCKGCTKCNRIKTLDLYYKCKRNIFGIISYCKECYDTIHKQKRIENFEKYTEQH